MPYALLRHLPTDIAPGLCYGRLDLPPGVGGDAGGALAVLEGFAATALFSSPARRCLALAEQVAARIGLPVRPDARLLELDFGAWEGMPWDDVPRAALDDWAADPWGFAPLVARAAARWWRGCGISTRLCRRVPSWSRMAGR
ncbi:histidine phosphatase family protein [Pseudoroseomonas wenyumeiae]